MPNTPTQTTPVNLPADLLAKMKEMKQYREEERGQTVEQILEGMIRSYIRVRERARDELTRMEEINRSYETDPYDCRDDFYSESESTEKAG